jgi:transposase
MIPSSVRIFVCVQPRPLTRPLPEHLPRVEIEVVPPEVQREGLDAYKRIGQEVSEVLERRPASLARPPRRRDHLGPILPVKPCCSPV